MDKQEVLDLLSQLQADVEWEQSIAFAAALDVAMKRVKDWERLKEKIKESKRWINVENLDYYTGYVCALSNLEGLMAEMEKEDDSN